ncbi:MAG: hypothetical protein ACJAS3_001831 [Roseivirga sp.]|jgi:hypothetical protein
MIKPVLKKGIVHHRIVGFMATNFMEDAPYPEYLLL